MHRLCGYASTEKGFIRAWLQRLASGMALASTLLLGQTVVAAGIDGVSVTASLLEQTGASIDEPRLEVTAGGKTLSLSRSELLLRSQVITVQKDSAYQRTMQYRAVPISVLLPSAADHASVQFVASDGFVANIAGQDLAGVGQAYLAIEELAHPWPPIDANNPHKTASAGPFYLVWLDPVAGKISNEQWPYQVAKIRVEQPLLQRYPRLAPAQINASAPAMRGLQVFLKNCAVCHKMNGAGDAEIGPDLNLPYNPTQYFQTEFLRKLIRQPSAVRTWKTSLMPGFDVKTISNAELDDLLSYLKAMAKSQKHESVKRQ
ncbi:cytochrome c [Undibacterium cyanobacteriorum]|uniref:Cytochrome c n=1 Tax=Undibacterium cyanobacteriorum TaxID=3073561 RepID=A0ABY9RFP2_9BURK|nr:cytochrome c [Undibacterium sp. 20NA77.5]WMW80046.1 cytochrome c [Undibacterium sp. 20NA77.5]